MLLAIDIHYKATYAKCVGVLFNWEDESPNDTIITTVKEVQPYIPGEFYKRELPCVLKVIEKVNLATLEAIIVDGHVYVDNEKKFGLGGYLWKALDEKVPIIGIAKKPFVNTDKVSTPILRGNSTKPLFISSIGIAHEDVLQKVKLLHGAHRMPTLLKEMDRLTKTAF